MNYEQLIDRLMQNKLTTRKMGELKVAEIPRGTPLDHTLEIVSFAQIAHKYREAYETGGDIPDDLTDEIFAAIEENREAILNFKGPVIRASDLK